MKMSETLLSHTLRTLLFVGGLFATPHVAVGNDDGARYEVAVETCIVSEEHTQDDYMVAGVDSPGIRSRRERDYYDISGDFSFFFTPIPDDPAIPIALRRFYARSDTLHFSATFAPEHTTDYTFVNPDINYRNTSKDDEQLRQAGVDGVFYLFPDSGLRLWAISVKDEQVSFDTSPSVNTQSRNETNEIRRDYGIGVVQYVAEHLALTLDYTYHDDELRSVEKSWQDNPLVFGEVGRTADTTGYSLGFGGEYIWRKRLGFSLFYEYFSYESDSEVQMVQLENFPTDPSTFRDEGDQQTLMPVLRVYFGEKLMAQCGGGITWTDIVRTYGNATTEVEYAWNWWQAQGGVSYYVNAHFGVLASVRQRWRGGDVDMRSDGETRSTFHLDSDVQDIRIGVTGRF